MFQKFLKNFCEISNDTEYEIKKNEVRNFNFHRDLEPQKSTENGGTVL